MTFIANVAPPASLCPLTVCGCGAPRFTTHLRPRTKDLLPFATHRMLNGAQWRSVAASVAGLQECVPGSWSRYEVARRIFPSSSALLCAGVLCKQRGEFHLRLEFADPSVGVRTSVRGSVRGSTAMSMSTKASLSAPARFSGKWQGLFRSCLQCYFSPRTWPPRGSLRNLIFSPFGPRS